MDSMDWVFSIMVFIWVALSIVLRVLKATMSRAEQGAKEKARTLEDPLAAAERARRAAAESGRAYEAAPVQANGGKGPTAHVEGEHSFEGVSGDEGREFSDSGMQDLDSAGYEGEGDFSSTETGSLFEDRVKEWEKERVKTWDVPADAGSLGPIDAPADEPIAKRAEEARDVAGRVDGESSLDEWDALYEAEWESIMGESEDDGGGRPSSAVDSKAIRAVAPRCDSIRQTQMPGMDLSGLGPAQATKGMVWGIVLGPPRCRSNANRRPCQ